MSKVKLGFQINDEEGKVIGDGRSAGKILAGSLMRTASKDKEADILKYYDWAMKLGKNEPLELDEGDVTILKDFITKDEMMFVLVKAPLIRALNNAKDPEEESAKMKKG